MNDWMNESGCENEWDKVHELTFVVVAANRVVWAGIWSDSWL